MSEIIKKFISGLDGSDDNINIKDILSDEDILLFEKWVRIFSEMGPFTIVKSIKKIEEKEEMTAEDDIILIAYIKFFEQKLKHMRQGVESYGHLFEPPKGGKKDDRFDGDMYA